jgi:hypothetical protein
VAKKTPPEWVLSVFYSSELGMFILLLVSAFYLIDSILRVRRTIKKYNLTKHINSGIMIANLLTFSLFLLSDLLYYIVDGFSTFYILSNRAQVAADISWDISTVFSFLGQTILCLLIQNMSNIQHTRQQLNKLDFSNFESSNLNGTDIATEERPLTEPYSKDPATDIFAQANRRT